MSQVIGQCVRDQSIFQAWDRAAAFSNISCSGVEGWAMLRLLVVLLVGLLCTTVWPGLVDAKRVGLVVGNNKYAPGGRDLENAVEDASAVAEILKEHDYEFVSANPAQAANANVAKPEFVALIDKFLAAIDPGDTVVFFFGGHGFQDADKNYLIPSGMRPLPGEAKSRQKILQEDAYSFKDLLNKFIEKREEFKKAGQTDISGVFILDACRDFPIQAPAGAMFIDTIRSGLLPMTPVGGTFVMYSADVGQSALDRLGPNDHTHNSVYTRELKKLLGKADRDLVDMAKELKWRVYELALTAEAEAVTQTPVFFDGFIYSTAITGERVARRGDGDTSINAVNAMMDPRKERALVAATQATFTRSFDSGVKTIVDCPGCPELVIVRGQTFTIGSPVNETGHEAHEAQAEIRLEHQYAIGKHEVTWAEWQLCVNSKDNEKKCDPIKSTGYADVQKQAEASGDGERRGPGDGFSTDLLPDHRRPIINVTWDQAHQYVRFLSATTGGNYRLPTEAEWEFAARGGSHGAYSFLANDRPLTGSALNRALCQHANGADRSLKMWLWDGNKDCDDGFATKPAPVGSFRANPFGLYDVHGNVWEWVHDCWRPRHEAGDGKAKASDGPEAKCDRTARGGSWQSEPRALRSASRTSFSRSHARATLGFRVARDVIQAPPVVPPGPPQ
jgi:formylglycine-generating enzyme required for sulfatase activity